jgi:hypothetical protein
MHEIENEFLSYKMFKKTFQILKDGIKEEM